MLSARVRTAALAFCLICVVAIARPVVADDFYLPPEHFGANRTADFFKHAQEYLAQHPTAENAPRVALDVVMMATLTGNVALVNHAKLRLLLSYPGSLYTAYLLSTIGQPQELQQILRTALEDPQQELTMEFCRGFCGAVRAGGRRFGDALLADDTFLFECALLARGAGDSQLLVGLRTAIERGSGESKQLAAVAFDGTLDDAERVLKLHDMRTNSAAQVAERFFYSRLTAEEREQPRLLKMAAESRLERGEFAEALPLLEKLLQHESDPQALFWRAWSLASLDRRDELGGVVSELATKHSDSPWHALAAELATDVEHLDGTLGEHAKVLAEAVVRLRDDGPELLELRVDGETKSGRGYSAYVGLDTSRQHAEAVFSLQNDVMLAGRLAQGKVRLYIKGESAIHEFPAAGAIPALPSLQLSRLGEGQFHLATVPSQGGLAGIQQTRTALLESPWLSTPDGLAELLKRLPAKGSFAKPVVKDDDGHKLVWYRPRIDRPEWQTVSVHVNAEGRVDTFQAEGVRGFELRYAPAAAFELIAPDWPDLPVEPKDRMDPAGWFRLFASVMSLFSDQAGSTAPGASSQLTPQP